ncbi:MAG: DUF4330 domain-containing protein [Clostridiales bacterium]|nr:DUF4330 domain-containing protein [Clostridiales bacterium]
MFLDKKGKIFGKISIIDLLVIIIFAVAAVGIGARFVTSAAKNAREKVHFSYVVEIDGVRKYTVDALNKKGLVTDLKSKSVLGEIKSVQSQPMKTQSVTSDGRMVFAEVPERYTVLVEVEGEGKESDSSYFVGNDVELSVGSTMSMTTKYANSSGKVKSIEKAE